MNKLIFGTAKEAQEFVGMAKTKGYDVSKPIKEKRAKSAKKMFDLDGKPVKFQWEVVLGAKGVGKKGGKRDEEWGAEKEWSKIKHETVDLRELKHKTKSGKEAYGRETNGIGKKEETPKKGARHYYEGMEYGEQN